jgi:hypothetical protein
LRCRMRGSVRTQSSIFDWLLLSNRWWSRLL